MDIQQHVRTHQIKELSGKLYQLLTLIRGLLYLGWPAIFVVAFFVDEGTLVLGEGHLDVAQLGNGGKFLVLSLFAIGLGLFVGLTNRLRDLMRYYMKGDLFSQQAVGMVRQALNIAGLIFALMVIQGLLGWVFSHGAREPIVWSLGADLLVAAAFFGFMVTLMWLLEICSDLDDEARNTI